MRWTLVATLGLSFAAHVAVTAPFVVPRHRADAVPVIDPPPQMAGETFELPAPETADTPLSNASPSPDNASTPAPIEDPDAPARPTPPRSARSATRPSHEGRPSAGRAASVDPEGAPGSTGSGDTYGAVGDRSAADLATAFTRGFPQAASGDPAWRNAPLGSAGEATVSLTIDDDGRITDFQVAGQPTSPLADGIRRTMALIKGRSFVAKSKTTKLHIVATVSAGSIGDGLHGEVFAIGGAYAGGEGSGFFALAIGRRIDVRVRAR